MARIVVLLTFVGSLLLAENNISSERFEELKSQNSSISEELDDDNIYRKIYSNYQTFNSLKAKLERVTKELGKTKKSSGKYDDLIEQQELLQSQIALLKEYEKNPFKKVMQPKKVQNDLTVDNPFAIVAAFSYLKQMTSDKEDYLSKFENLQELVAKLKQKRDILEQLVNKDPRYEARITKLNDEINTYEQLLKTYNITKDVYLKEITERKIEIEQEIEKELERLFILLAILFVLFVFVFLSKFGVKKYISDNERYYLANKTINLTFVTIAILIIAFRYIENVSYIVTFLGFASAGIAIAMKDWFMSVIGWIVIVFGGSVHVGDRIKVRKDGLVYVGDVIDISLFRMTVHEDITLTTYMENRRSGRIVFVPNHYIFTSLIANYSHSGMKTVWDGIDFTITFDSNIAKSSMIAKDIAKKYAKGYTNITRTQLNRLRSKYSLKNTNVEPRVFSFIEANGVRISVWYMTNAFATLTLRSNISAEIVEAVQREDDITLAYPTQSIYLDKDVRKPDDAIEIGENNRGVIV